MQTLAAGEKEESMRWVKRAVFCFIGLFVIVIILSAVAGNQPVQSLLVATIILLVIVAFAGSYLNRLLGKGWRRVKKFIF